MGANGSKRKLADAEEEIRSLRGRLQEIPKKTEENERLTREINTMKRQMARHAVTEKEEEITMLKKREQELLDQLKEKESQLETIKKDKDKELQDVRTQLEKKNTSFARRVKELEDVDRDHERRIAVGAASMSPDASMPEGAHLTKKRTVRGMAISAEPGRMSLSDVIDEDTKTHDKTAEVKEMIKESIEDNDFLQNLEEDQIAEIINAMQPVTKMSDTYIIKEGEDGDKLYVMEEGRIRVEKKNHLSGENEIKRQMGPTLLFGELAILYNTPRTASIFALEECKLWSLERHTFQVIMMKTGLTKIAERIKLIKRCPKFRDFSEDLLNLIAEAFDQNHYENDENIVLQGAKGETLYMILSGNVEGSKVLEDGQVETRLLYKGDFFGEKGLDGEETREETMKVKTDEGASCLSIDRETLNTIIKKHGKKVSQIREKSLSKPSKRDIPEKLQKARLGDLLIIQTLGVGGFGRVELVQVGEDSSATYALKQIKKAYVVQSSQQEHIINERKIMLECRSDFIVKLHRTYRNNKSVFMLMDTCLGGELWRLLRDRGPFDDPQTRFFTACAIEALAYLHARGMVYRDLKPENLLVDSSGYLKLVDFGFAKKIGHGKKTWTFCGTPDYVAPEIILNKGHDFAVDLWALGILMFELLTGNPPFTASEAMQTYNRALKGIDTIQFPRRVSKNARDLIRKLCREAPNERIGYGRAGIVEIQKHKWYDGFNWETLRKHNLEAPIKPTIRGVTDTGNFDEYDEDREIPKDELSGWDKEFAEIV